MLTHGLGRFFIATTLEQVKYQKVLSAVLLVTCSVLHRSVGEQTADTVYAPYGVYEEGIS